MTPLSAAVGLHRLGLDLPLLTLIVFLPVIGALLVGLASVLGAEDRVAKIVGIGSSVLTGVLSIFLLLAFDRGLGDFQFVSQHEWLPSFGIQYKLGVDGISLFLVVLSGLLFPVALFAAKIEQNVKGFVAWMLMLEAGCIGAFVALDLFLFFVCFEVVLVPMYFLIGGWGFARRGYAALKFFLYTLAGSVFLLVATLGLAFINARHTGHAVTFDFATLQQEHAFSATEGRWLFFAFALAFGVKVPVFPLHTWLPDTYEQSPIVGVVVSAGVMVKLGTYGLVRFCLALFPQAAHDFVPLMLTLALIGMIYGAVVAAVQRDLKRLVAYSSLSHLGFIVLGSFSESSLGVSGAVLQMINHGLSTGALFLLLGMIYARRGTTSIAELKGMQKKAPVLAAVFTVVMLSSIGVPGLNGFVGELLTLLGTYTTHRWWAVVGTGTLVLAAVYLLWAYQRVFHGEPDADTPDMTMSDRLLMVPLIALIVLLGVYPKPVLDRIEPSVDRLVDHTTADSVQPADVTVLSPPGAPAPTEGGQ